MSIEVYNLAPLDFDERQRERAVEESGALTATDDPTLLQIAEQARKLLKTAMSAITIVNGDWQYIIAAVGIPTGPYSRRTSFCGQLIAGSGEVMCVPDAQVDPRFAANPAVAGTGLVRFYSGAPILDRTGFPLGALCVFDAHPHDCLSAAEEHQLRQLASAVTRRLVELQAEQRMG